MRHHALREQAVKRLPARQINQTAIAKAAREKARIEQVQHGVFHPAHILIDGEPAGRRLFIERRAVFPGKLGEIPGGIGKGVERIGFALCVLAARPPQLHSQLEYAARFVHPDKLWAAELGGPLSIARAAVQWLAIQDPATLQGPIG